MTQGLDKILSWSIGSRSYSLDFSKPLIMAIINVTPDSFSDGGLFFEPAKAIELAANHLKEGADILDLGAETTRPGSQATDEKEEWRRLEPILSYLANLKPTPVVSVDTNKASVAQRALEAGASIINDIYAGRNDPQIFEVAATYGAPIILMHMLGEPRTMQIEPHYQDVVTEVRDFLLERALAAEKAGIPKERIILDPGLGFGKNADHNLRLLNRFEQVIPQGYHSMMALSRKNFLGRILEEQNPLNRDLATAAANAIAVNKGAQIVRVHRVGPSLQASKVAFAARLESPSI
ncbi:MAG: dihydropteroate synthase [Deltaproteobacteria bacterium]|jgi:dihydropteroate synthase|nr:dihydropteroate synthase [Deltaproteobacteria bacterium]